MTEQTPQDEAREEEKNRPVPRDAAYWAKYAEMLKVTGVGFFLAFGEWMRQAGSKEHPVDDRGRQCPTPAPCCPPPSYLT